MQSQYDKVIVETLCLVPLDLILPDYILLVDANTVFIY